MKKQLIRAQINPQRWKGAEPELVNPEGDSDQTKELQRRPADVIEKALRVFENKLLNDESLKPTLGDYFKLLQLEKEIAQQAEGPREIRVTWIEPDLNSSEE